MTDPDYDRRRRQEDDDWRLGICVICTFILLAVVIAPFLLFPAFDRGRFDDRRRFDERDFIGPRRNEFHDLFKRQDPAAATAAAVEQVAVEHQMMKRSVVADEPPPQTTTSKKRSVGRDSHQRVRNQQPVQKSSVNLFGFADAKSESSSTLDLTPISVKVAVVGGGAGGIASAYFATEAFHHKGISKNQMSVALFEETPHLGGNVKQVELARPGHYDGSFGTRLYGDLASDRSPLNTLGLKRRLYNHLNVSVFYTPFKNYVNSRGQSVECDAPNVKATALFAKLRAEHGDDYMMTPDAIAQLSSAFIERCLYAPEFTARKSGVYGDVLGDITRSRKADEILPNAYTWLLTGMQFESALYQWRTNTSAYDWPYVEPNTTLEHPAHEGASCVLGVDCVSDRVFMPKPADVQHVLSGIARAFGWEPDKVLNYALAWYLVAHEVSAGGNWIEDTGFSSFLSNQLREYGHTNDVYGFPVGGDRQLLLKMIRKAESKGAHFYASEKVLSIDRLVGSSNVAKFRLVTNKHIVMVEDVLIANLPPYYLFGGGGTASENHPHAHNHEVVPSSGGSGLTGNVVEKLRVMPEVQAPVVQDVLRVLIQFTPGVRAWFRDLMTDDGQYSVRKFGIEGDSCFASMEFVDVPHKACTNEVVVGFKCHKCQVRFEALLHQAKHGVNGADQADATEALMQLAWDELRAAWPRHASAIPRPIKVAGGLFVSGRHSGGRHHDYMSNGHVALTAQQPFPGVPFALVGEAYQNDYQGWMEAALLTAQNAVQLHVGALPGMEMSTNAIFYHIYSILREINTSAIADGSKSSVFALIPPLYAQASPPIEVPKEHLLDNEFWWPHATVHEFSDEAGDFCRAEAYGLGHFALVE